LLAVNAGVRRSGYKANKSHEAVDFPAWAGTMSASNTCCKQCSALHSIRFSCHLSL